MVLSIWPASQADYTSMQVFTGYSSWDRPRHLHVRISADGCTCVALSWDRVIVVYVFRTTCWHFIDRCLFIQFHCRSNNNDNLKTFHCSWRRPSQLAPSINFIFLLCFFYSSKQSYLPVFFCLYQEDSNFLLFLCFMFNHLVQSITRSSRDAFILSLPGHLSISLYH